MASLLAATSPQPQQRPEQEQRDTPAGAGASVSIQSLKAAAEAAKQPLDADPGEGQQATAPDDAAGEAEAAAAHLSAEDDAAAAQLEVLHALLLLLPPPEVGCLLHASAISISAFVSMTCIPRVVAYHLAGADTFQGSRLAQRLADGAHQQGSKWPADLRAGVASVLRSRAPPATRQVITGMWQE